MTKDVTAQGTYCLSPDIRRRLDAVVEKYSGAVSKQAVLRFGIELGVAALEKDPSALFGGWVK